MTRHLLTLLLLLLSLPLPLPAVTPYMEAVDEADKACAAADWAKALDAIDRAIAIEPDNPGNILLMSNKGLIQFNLGQDSAAITTLSDAHVAAPRSVTILLNRARVYTANGRDAEALADYARVIELDSTDTTALLHHGLLSLSHRKFGDAKADIDRLAALRPGGRDATVGEAALHCALGEYAEAIPLYNRLILDFKDDEFYGARAYCRLMTGELQEASDDIARALELSPADGELYLYRAALNKMRFRPEDAKRDARRAVELGVDPLRAKEFM